MRTVAFIGLLLALMMKPASLDAAEPSEIGFELYSWKTGENWYFSVLEGTATTRSLSAIQAPKTRLRGPVFLKGRLAGIPDGEMVYWREDKKRGLYLPPKEIVRDISQFAETSQIRLVLPEN